MYNVWMKNDNTPNKQIYGFISRDKNYDILLKKNIYFRELVWFNNEDVLKPFGLYYKNHLLFNDNKPNTRNIYEQFKDVTLEFLPKIKEFKANLTINPLLKDRLIFVVVLFGP